VHSIVFAVAGLAATVIALLAIWLMTSGRGFWGGGLLDNLTVSRDWLVHHRDDDRS
jgi:hypothetical protein